MMIRQICNWVPFSLFFPPSLSCIRFIFVFDMYLSSFISFPPPSLPVLYLISPPYFLLFSIDFSSFRVYLVLSEDQFVCHFESLSVLNQLKLVFLVFTIFYHFHEFPFLNFLSAIFLLLIYIFVFDFSLQWWSCRSIIGFSPHLFSLFSLYYKWFSFCGWLPAQFSLMKWKLFMWIYGGGWVHLGDPVSGRIHLQSCTIGDPSVLSTDISVERKRTSGDVGLAGRWSSNY